MRVKGILRNKAWVDKFGPDNYAFYGRVSTTAS